MKKLLLLTILLCTSMMQATAYEWTDANGVTWTFSNQNWSYDDNGDGNNTNHSYYTITAASNYGDDVVVPQTVYNGETPYTIEAIGSSVFSNNTTLTSVALPTTIKFIATSAFSGCTALATVTGTGNCEYVSTNAFYGCSSLTQIDLTACKYIRNYAFQNCTQLADIVSISNCKYFGGSSFRGCTSLQEIDLGEDVNINGSAFQNCSSLQRVGSLKGATIGNEAFYGCSSLESVDISQAQSLGDYAFYGCSNLTTVGDLSAYTAIGNGVFYGCSKLESVDLSNCESIGNNAFQKCSTLESVDLSKVTTIGYYAFANCTSLEDVGDISAFTSIPNGLFRYTKLDNLNLPNVTSVGYDAFAYCRVLTTISLPKCTTISNANYDDNGAFYNCKSLSTINLPKVTTIGSYAFYSCSSLAEISLPKVTTIGSYAFNGCSNLNSLNITSTELVSVGFSAFTAPGTITLMTTTPPTLGGSSAFSSLMVVRVPDAALTAYRTADIWSSFANRIVGIGTKIDYDVTVYADDSRSTLHETIGEENLQNVVTLKVTGDINGYDIMVMRNKMDNLHYLDLTDANIVANNYEYYTGYHTENNVLGGYSFYNLQKLLDVKLPKTITALGTYAFQNCSNLKNVEFQTGLKSIGSYAFQNCCNLKNITLNEGLETIGDYAFGINYNSSSNQQPQEEELIIPNGVTSIGYCAFGYNKKLKRVYFPNTLKTIGTGAFYSCYQLESISLPTSLEAIPYRAFYECSNLTRVDIPSTITSIGDEAFSGCSKLNDVYTYIVEPTPIDMNTFSTYTTAILHVPSTSYYNYWYDTKWSQFRRMEEFLAEYQYFYINNDFVIADETGTIQAEYGEDDPDADLNPGSGLIVNTEDDNPQMLDEMHIKANNSTCASVITANNLVANKVYFDIEIQANRWYFLAFPFDVKAVNVAAPGSYAIREYDAEARAEGNPGWTNIDGDLEKGKGYIFRCAKAGTLSLCVEKNQTRSVNISWAAENRPLTLTSAPSENALDASWNFLGNPQTSYFDIDKTGYTQPITVWNGSSYEAVRSGDDAYALKPFEAFFVQKPTNKSEIDFPADGRYTKTQWQHELTEKAAARRAEGVKTDRSLVNLVLTDGQTEDKTRVVFNEKASKDYEIDCDAAKFLSSDIPQLYSLDQRLGRYAINERPMGEVCLGYVAPAKGELAIKAVRMDQPVMLRDTKLQITHDLSIGDYTFTTEAGTFNERFVLVVDGSATNVAQLRQETGVSVMAEEGGISFLGIGEEPVNVYSVGGVLMAGNVGNSFLSLPKATYLVKVGTSTAKVIVR